MLQAKPPLLDKILSFEATLRLLAPITDVPLKKFKSSQSRSDLRLGLIGSYETGRSDQGPTSSVEVET